MKTVITSDYRQPTIRACFLIVFMHTVVTVVSRELWRNPSSFVAEKTSWIFIEISWKG
jgi:hypothetical protein